MEITEDQLKVFQGLRHVQMKDRVTNCMLVAFFIILIFFILLFTCIKSGWPEKTITGVLEGILARSFYPIIKHYYPAYIEAKEAEQREKKN